MGFLVSAIASEGILSGFRAPLFAAGVSLVVSWVSTPFVRRFAISKGAIDDPTRDDRRVHTEPVPRWGGLAIYLGFLVATLLVLPLAYSTSAFPNYVIGMLVLGLAVVIVGAYDDLFQFPAKIQLLFLLLIGTLIQLFSDPVRKVQILSLGVPFAGSPKLLIAFGLASIPLTSFYVFVVTKTMDTIDGIDGLTAGIGAISACTLAIIAAYGGQPRVAILAAALAGSALGFLRHNYNPAKIFMGTGGAQFLGFSLAVLSIVGALKTAAAVAVLVPVFAFGVPIFDAFFVVIRRVVNRVPITQGDKRHMHHTLLGMGLSQRQAVLVLYALAVTLSGALLMVVLKRNG